MVRLIDADGEASTGTPGVPGPLDTVNDVAALHGPLPTSFQVRTHHIYTPTPKIYTLFLHDALPIHTAAAVYHCWMTLPPASSTHR